MRSVKAAGRDQVLKQFHRIFYDRRQQTWENTSWLGVPLLKSPFDLWVYQELMWRLKPDLVVETGSAYGGSALYFATMLDIIGKGRVITIDVASGDGKPQHPRIEYVTASSVAPETVARVHDAARDATVVFGVLDSDHSRDHVLKELQAYADVVTPGSYLVVEDSCVNGHPVAPSHGPGPWEAVDTFLSEDSRYEADLACEKYLMTMNPRGWLRRVH